jgi:hypothetical protein
MDLLRVTMRKLCNREVCVLGMEITSFLRDKQRMFSYTKELKQTGRLAQLLFYYYK